ADTHLYVAAELLKRGVELVHVEPTERHGVSVALQRQRLVDLDNGLFERDPVTTTNLTAGNDGQVHGLKFTLVLEAHDDIAHGLGQVDRAADEVERGVASGSPGDAHRVHGQLGVVALPSDRDRDDLATVADLGHGDLARGAISAHDSQNVIHGVAAAGVLHGGIGHSAQDLNRVLLVLIGDDLNGLTHEGIQAAPLGLGSFARVYPPR